MPNTTATQAVVTEVRHEEFCLPRPGQAEPRIEVYPHYEDHPKSGRAYQTHTVTRCIECGAARYTESAQYTALKEMS